MLQFLDRPEHEIFVNLPGNSSLARTERYVCVVPVLIFSAYRARHRGSGPRRRQVAGHHRGRGVRFHRHLRPDRLGHR